MTLKKEAQDLLKKYGIRPLKKFGQNFLINRSVLNKIISAADLNKKDVVLEVGPGIGILTREIAKQAGEVIAIEKDRKMCELLKDGLKDFNNVNIIQDDVLKIGKLKVKNYKVVANLPFYITSPVIRKFLEVGEAEPQHLKEMVLMVQKEVAQRICSKPPQMSILAVSVQFYAEVKIISYVSKKSFWPQPKVDSAIIKIMPKKDWARSGLDQYGICRFFEIVKAGFSQPRKQLANNLSKKLDLERKEVEEWLSENDIKPSQRAETLNVKDWINLTKSLE